jgi:hypothetical protein
MIGYVKALVLIMFGLLYHEAPAIEHSTNPVHIQHREDVQALGNIFYTTGQPGDLVSPDIDPLILAAMSFEESRFRQHGSDGDPRFTGGRMYCPKPGPCYSPRTPVVKVGQSVGPMQISRGAPTWVQLWEKAKYEDVEPWHGLTLEQLREPSNNVSFAYMLLKRFKRECGGSPAVWIDSYGRGHCSPGGHFGNKAKIRCKHVDSFVKKMKVSYPQFEAPEGFVCTTWIPSKN